MAVTLKMEQWEAMSPFEILGRLQGLKWQQEQALAALAGRLGGWPQDTESPTREAGSDVGCTPTEPETTSTIPGMQESPQFVQAALNAGQNSVSLVGVCPYCEHELLIPVSVAVAET